MFDFRMHVMFEILDKIKKFPTRLNIYLFIWGSDTQAFPRLCGHSLRLREHSHLDTRTSVKFYFQQIYSSITINAVQHQNFIIL